MYLKSKRLVKINPRAFIAMPDYFVLFDVDELGVIDWGFFLFERNRNG